MSLARFILGIAALACVCSSLGVAAAALRARLLPTWHGAPAVLADSVVGLGLLIGALELLGAIGLFRLGPIVAASALIGAGMVRVAGSPARPRAGASQRTAGEPAGGPAGGSAGRPAGGPAGSLGAGGSLARAVAALATGLVFAEWAVPTLHSYDVGIKAFDSLWYHMPWAATFAQTGLVTPLHFTDVEYLTAFYPASAELVHGAGIVLLGSDVLSPGLNLAFLALTLLAAWCVGHPRGVGHLTLTAGALALAMPMLRFSQAGSAANDVVGVFLLLAALALLANAWPPSVSAERGPGSAAAPERDPFPPAAVALAALAAGLAVGVKLSLLAPVLALSVGIVTIAPRAQRVRIAGLWVACLVVAGGFWYLRDLIAVGNPLPWVSLGLLPTPAAPLQAHTAFTVLHYAGNARIWSRIFLPGLADGLGPLWPLILAAAILGPLACVALGRDRFTRMLGMLALASLAAYLLTPESAAGPLGHPTGFAFNLRYAAPALTLGLIAASVASVRAGERAITVALGALAVVLLATLAQSRLWPPGYGGAGLLIGAVTASVMLAFGGRGRLGSARGLSAGTIVAGSAALVVAGTALAHIGERHYERGRYVYEPGVSSLSTLWQWFRHVHDARVGLVGTFGGFFSYPLFGLDGSNQVTYIAHRGSYGSFAPIRSCRQWRDALDGGRFRYVVLTPGRDPWHPKRLESSPEGRWTAGDPAAQRVFLSFAAGQPISVYELRGPLDPAGCRAGPNRRRSSAGPVRHRNAPRPRPRATPARPLGAPPS